MIICRSIFLRMKNLLPKTVEKIKTNTLCSITSFRKSCHLWDNVQKYGTARQATADNIIWRIHIVVCWKTKAVNTLRICNTYCFSTATIVTRTRLNITSIRTLPVLLVFEVKYVEYPFWSISQRLCLEFFIRNHIIFLYFSVPRLSQVC
jgi:hypothetical protein